ncbi:outer membrane protein assembly factor BamD [Bacteroidales bacterium OttesenSCG-928-B11]|nr:outer membrane protein assembly factor BamD [Bacteroidales bacterium OttesenSCG-928-B11]
MKKLTDIFFSRLKINILYIFIFTICCNVDLFSSTNSNIAIPDIHFFTPEDTVKNDDGTKKKKEKLENREKSNKKKVTFETFEKNYNRAMKFYKNQQYLSAARLFEELYPLSIGTPYGDTILFTFANCYYLNKNYELAAFHFKDYARRYSGTPKGEEAYFLCVKSVYNVSPIYSLDQFETKYAIEEIGYFIQQYPTSTYMDECNTMLDQLREKLARKDYEVAKLYYYTGNYQAVQISIRNFMKDFSFSDLAPDACYLLVQSNFDYAKKSVDSKQMERYLQCLDAFETLKANHPVSPLVEQAAKIVAEAEKNMEKINAKNKR